LSFDAILDALESFGVPAQPHLGVAELAHLARLDGAAELRRHRLHPVADAEHRHALLEHRLGRARRRSSFAEAWLPDRMMPRGSNSRMNSALTS
jgi:hypothetical protein